ncbi:MAG: glutamine--fructose-6-phosphate transaminase (isomerizing) [Parcubacteria group bacterium]|nr:glutamine--fructose-6-phosphate transaminase (isomerizing) [Parcubacteria group bacterium]
MCGIFGYIGNDERSVLKAVRGLKDLEYRGYDSWGVAVKTPRDIFIQKAVGKISSVPESNFNTIEGTISIGHTRWATHGGVSPQNAHPHFNRNRTIAVVHNGIIENHESLRAIISEKFGNQVFRSETDTEVIPLLIELFMESGLSFERAFIKTAQKLKGRFAYVALHKDEPFILAAKEGSPLIMGVGTGEYFIASDTPAFLDYTNQAYFFENGEYAKIEEDKATFFNIASGKTIQKKKEKILWEKESASKGGHAHFMLKEILDQRELIDRAVTLGASPVSKAAKILKKADSVFFTAMGTAAHMSMVGEYVFSHIANKAVQPVYAAEFEKILPFINKETVVCGISQSGETADLLESYKNVRERKGKILSILNVRGSSAERESDFVIPVNAGPEKAVASTKAATAQAAILTFLSYALSGKQKQGEKKLLAVSKAIKEWLTDNTLTRISSVARKIKESEDLYVIGKSVQYPIALEAALKIKEVSYIHAEGFAAGELKHGTLALVEKGTPCIALISDDECAQDVLSASQELKARGAFLIGISPSAHTLFDCHIEIPSLGYETFFMHMLASHVLAYYLAVLRGLDPDKPRNLAKSVTVK